MNKTKMICPHCGVEMNHHADKVDHSVSDPNQIDDAFGGVLEEAFTCPICGRTHLRKAEE